jgi:hypothetical protein
MGTKKQRIVNGVGLYYTPAKDQGMTGCESTQKSNRACSARHPGAWFAIARKQTVRTRLCLRMMHPINKNETAGRNKTKQNKTQTTSVFILINMRPTDAPSRCKQVIPRGTYRFGFLLFVLGVLNNLSVVRHLGRVPVSIFAMLTITTSLVYQQYADTSDEWNGLLISSVLYVLGLLAIFKVFPMPGPA